MSNDKAFKVKNGLELAGYDTSKAVTAVDVFVYDTSRDSDGGAWRKRTQGTSWYNETLDTPTRGSRKEFPAVAVIVAESDTVTIYDGDDPSLPMWMVFNEGTANYIYSNGDALTSVNASNGMLVVGTFRLQVINFVSDSGWKSEDSWYYYSVKPISSRNDTNTTAYNNTGLRIVNPNVNDVAMTVLPNAPIDAATGLPVPTIAVATDGGDLYRLYQQ
jgi:trimeric autotransporter adhesin